MPPASKQQGVTIDVESILDRMEEVAEQMAAASTTDKESWAFARWLNGSADKISGSEVLSNLADFNQGEVDDVVAMIQEWAGKLAPQANTKFNNEQVRKDLAILEALSAVPGYLSDEQAETLREVSETLASTKRLGSRAPQPRIEGRPAYVVVNDPAGNEISKQVGNVSNSVGNIKQTVVAYIKRTLERDATADEVKGVHEAIKEVVTGGKPESSFAGFVFQGVGE